MNKRLISLDTFRGITIAGMILVNNPGSWGSIYPPLQHADWHGCTPTDLVFPFFLFIVGVAIALALPRQLSRTGSKQQVFLKALKRSVVLFLLGECLAGFPFFGAKDFNGGLTWLYILFLILLITSILIRDGLNSKHFKDPRSLLSRKVAVWTGVFAAIGMLALGWGHFDLSHLRIPGVLQRISLVYLACTALFLFTSPKAQVYIGLGLLIGYWLIITLIPVPGVGPADLGKDTNLGAWLDRLLLDGHLWSQAKTWDPEGILSTLPAIVTGLMGVFCGRWLQSDTSENTKVVWMFVAGSLAIMAGLVWDWFFPINKQLWTSSFVLYTGGLALQALALCYWFVDVLGYEKWTRPFVHFGSNAIVLYVFSGFVARTVGMIQVGAGEDTISLKGWIMEHLFNSWLSPLNASLAAALVTVFLFWIAALILYKKRIFIKV